MNKLVDLNLDRAFPFKITDNIHTSIDENGIESPVDITGWTIKGTAIIDVNDTSSDIPITGAVTDGENGVYDYEISDENRIIILDTLLTKAGIFYEVKGAPLTGESGETLKFGTLNLIQSRPRSSISTNILNIPYTVEANYTFDSDKIEIVDGLAILKENLTDIYARWHLNELSGTNVPDDSGNSREGLTQNMEDSDWVTGQINNALSFNGGNEFVNFGDIANFERTQNFSIEAWIKTSASAGTIISRRQSGGTNKGWHVNITNGQIGFNLTASTVTGNRLIARTVTATFDDGVYHHVTISYDGSSLVSGVKIYVGGILQNIEITTDNLTASIVNVANCNLSGYDNGTDLFTGDIDEVVIYTRVLTQAEVTYRFNSGIGREDFIRYSDSPTIELIDLFDPVEIISLDAFSELLGNGTQGSLGYNLYKVDKVNKYYWSGSVWVVGGSTVNQNDVAIIDINMSTFDLTPDKIGALAYLISDGFQLVSINLNSIGFTPN